MIIDKNICQKITNLRREYTKNRIRRKDLPEEPIELFEKWLKQALKAKINDPTAVVVATVNEFKQPYQRIVLLKYYDKKGLVFYTNLNSRKAYHIKKNPLISLLFPWIVLERQIIVTGIAERLDTLEVIKYFHSRPRESQISSWISKQSDQISSRDILDNKFLEFKNKFQECDIPLPKFWGGFRVFVKQMEFWQGGKYRLHDRFVYTLNNRKWKINRLAP